MSDGGWRRTRSRRCRLTRNCTFARQIKLSCALSLSSGLQPHNHWVHAYMGLINEDVVETQVREIVTRNQKAAGPSTPSSSMVTFRITMKCLRPWLVKLYLGLSVSSQVSLYHETIALSKDTSHSKVADWRSLTSTLWMRLVKWICSAITDKGTWAGKTGFGLDIAHKEKVWQHNIQGG